MAYNAHVQQRITQMTTTYLSNQLPKLLLIIVKFRKLVKDLKFFKVGTHFVLCCAEDGLLQVVAE